MSDEPTTPEQPVEPDQPEQPTQPDEPDQGPGPEQGQSQDLGGQWQDANENAKTNVGAELTDDESTIADHSSRAHNERVGQQQ